MYLRNTSVSTLFVSLWNYYSYDAVCSVVMAVYQQTNGKYIETTIACSSVVKLYDCFGCGIISTHHMYIWVSELPLYLVVFMLMINAFRVRKHEQYNFIEKASQKLTDCNSCLIFNFLYNRLVLVILNSIQMIQTLFSK